MIEKAYLAEALEQQQFGVENFRRLSSSTSYLNVIDTLWKDHLLAMDHLRQGIGAARRYGFRSDPARSSTRRKASALFQQG